MPLDVIFIYFYLLDNETLRKSSDMAVSFILVHKVTFPEVFATESAFTRTFACPKIEFDLWILPLTLVPEMLEFMSLYENLSPLIGSQSHLAWPHNHFYRIDPTDCTQTHHLAGRNFLDHQKGVVNEVFGCVRTEARDRGVESRVNKIINRRGLIK